MPILSFFHFTAGILYLFTAIYSLRLNFYRRFNQLCATLLLCFAIWSFGNTISQNPHVSHDLAKIGGDIAQFGWLYFGAIMLWFLTLFAGKKELAESLAFKIIIFFIPTTLLTRFLFGYPFLDEYVRVSYGWFAPWKNSYWTILFFIYYFASILAGLFIIIRFRKLIKDRFHILQMNILVVTTLFALFIGTAANIIQIFLPDKNIPPLANIIAVIWAIGIFFAIQKHHFLKLYDPTAANFIMARIPDLVVLVNQASMIVSCNNSVQNVLGYASGELEDKSLDFITVDDDDTKKLIGEIVCGKIMKETELTLRSKNGNLIPVMIATSPLEDAGIIIAATEIYQQKNTIRIFKQRHKKQTQQLETVNKNLTDEVKERHQVEISLLDAEEKFRALFENALDGYYMTNLNGALIDCNRSAEIMVGYDKNELIGTILFDLKRFPSNEAKKITQILDMNAIGKVTGLDELNIIRKDGSTLSIEISTHQIRVKNKMLILAIARNITDRKRSAREREKLKERMYQAQKMDAVGKLAGGIAHDFNNLLGAISGYAELIKQQYANDNEKLDKYTTTILTASKRAAELTSKLLVFASKDNIKLEKLNIHEIIIDTLPLLEKLIEENILIDKQLNALDIFIDGDYKLLQNVLINLAINARDAMPHGGKLIISTRNVTIDDNCRQLHPQEIRTGHYIILEATDDGIGMSKEVSDKIFDPFFTTKEFGKGIGLGLASTYGTLQSHNGCISVYSEENKGTTIKLYLPLSSRDEHIPHTIVNTKVNTKKTDTKKMKILIVDDEHVVREIASEMLSVIGYATISVKDGIEALAYYKDHYQEIDLIILDLIMPQMPGIDCFNALKEINPSTRVLVASGYSLNDDAKKILDNGALGFLQKPYDLNGLSIAVHDVLWPTMPKS